MPPVESSLHGPDGLAPGRGGADDAGAARPGARRGAGGQAACARRPSGRDADGATLTRTAVARTLPAVLRGLCHADELSRSSQRDGPC